jgi:hypothetical protein
MGHMDDLLITIIVAGIGLSIAYLRADLHVRREFKSAERKKNSRCVNGTSQDRAVNKLPCSGNRVQFPARFKQILSSL